MNESPWQKVALFLAGVIVSGVGAIAAYPRNVVNRDELPALISSYSQYTKDATDLRRQLDDQSHQIGDMQSEIQQLQVDIARISEHLGVPTPSRKMK